MQANLVRYLWSGVAAVVLGTLLAKWSWVFFAPPSLPVAAVPVVNVDGMAEKIFGQPASDVAQAGLLSNVRLIGLFSGKQGFAVLELAGKQMGVAVGQSITPGVKLQQVNADHVIIESGGVQQRINLPETQNAGLIVVKATSGQADNSVLRKATEALPHLDVTTAIANMDKMPPDQREAFRQQLMRGIPH